MFMKKAKQLLKVSIDYEYFEKAYPPSHEDIYVKQKLQFNVVRNVKLKSANCVLIVKKIWGAFQVQCNNK